MSLNRPLEADAFPSPPAGAEAEDAGFRDRDPGEPGLAARWTGRSRRAGVAAGVPAYRAGMAGAPGPTGRSHLDRRAGLGQGAGDPELAGGRLFGDLGELVRPAGLGAGVAYWSEDGDRVAIHALGLDLLVTGSVGEADLARVAASLPVAGRPVPAGWAEAATSTLPEAVAADPGLRRPRDLRGAPPAVRVDGRIVTLVRRPGSRGFLVQAPRPAGPPLDDPAGVRVRGTDGRWSPGRGELEWVEGHRTLTLRSTTLPLEELLAIAASLKPT